MNSRTFPATIEQLHAVLDWIRKEASLAGFAKSTLLKIELASEEAFVNIARHATPHQQAEVTIQIQTNPQTNFSITFIDKGPPFNPLLDAPTPREGVGIILMGKCMDHISYERIADQNILTLMKKF